MDVKTFERRPTVYRSAECSVLLAEQERRAAMLAYREARERVERANARLCEALEHETALRQGLGGQEALRASEAVSAQRVQEVVQRTV